MNINLSLNGSVYLEGSKSILNRVLILSTFSKTFFRLENFSSSTDVETIVSNLQRLGILISSNKGSATIRPQQKFKDNTGYFVKDSAAALRFLLTRLAFIPGLRSTFDVSDQLKERPIKPLINLLQDLGVDFSSTEFPLSFTGIEFTGGSVTIPVDVSSQYVSAFLLCSPQLKADLTIKFSGTPVSLSYIDLTLAVLSDFGITAIRKGNSIYIEKLQQLSPPDVYYVEPDISSACYFLALGALNNGKIKVHIPLNSTQPDIGFLEILAQMGASISKSDDHIIVRRNTLKGIEVDMSTMPDQVPTLACLALLADSPTSITGIEHLKYKESNRLKALLEELPKLGAKITYSSNKLVVEPLKKEPSPCQLNTYNDHRLVMSFSLLNTIFKEIRITGAEAVMKSFPYFFQTLHKLQN
jgi:3-phosphoshikimate 1-carboxyvinyltransferase